MTLSCEGAAGVAGGGTAVRRMEYPRMGALASLDAESRIRALEQEREERERQHALQLEEAGKKALQQGLQMAEKEEAAWRRKCETALSAALSELRSARDEYLAQVEREVVRLALAIAERILRREAQVDPLLLAGGVRAALGRLAASTAVRLRVSAEQQEMWAEMLRLMPGLPIRPEVVADKEMGSGDVAIETEVGMVDLSLRAQIGEIERGLLDRASASESPAARDGAGKRD